MFLNVENGSILMGHTEMDYISYGKGKQVLVILPGLGDGLMTVRGKAVIFAAAYRIYSHAYKVYVFSRKNRLAQEYSTRDMARDQAEAMKRLGITKAAVLGISQGGMIAQYLAIDYPELVEKLVLCVTLARQNDNIQKVVSHWTVLAQRQDYKGLLIDTAEHTYSEKKLKTYRLLYPFLGWTGQPADFSRFLIQASSCMRHNSYEELGRIKCPTLVIGGDNDQITGNRASLELAEAIQNSSLHIYEGLGHGAYEEAKDFHKRVLAFISHA